MSSEQPTTDALKSAGKRRDGLILLLLGAVVFLGLGFALEYSASTPSADFRALYYPARCLAQNADLYSVSAIAPVYQADSAYFPADDWKAREIATRNVYPPTAFTFMMPFAMLSWVPAHRLWLGLTVVSILFVSALMWRLTANYAPALAGALLALFLVNSELLVISSNAAGIVVSLCAVAVCCFVGNRYGALGVLCLAMSLTIKPQETGLVWLYFLLAGGHYRRRALETLLATVAIALPAVVWVGHVSPHWLPEWRANLAAFSAHGAINDPGPASMGGHGLAMVISLQAVLSVFRDDPRFYNLGSILVTAPLVLVWAAITLRTRATTTRVWLALASIAAITMLPVYHRQYDAKLLLLTLPACLMLWSRRGILGWVAVLMNTAAFVLTGDLTWALLLGWINHLPQPTTTRTYEMFLALQVFPAPMIVLALGVFYLWAYARSAAASDPESEIAG